MIPMIVMARYFGLRRVGVKEVEGKIVKKSQLSVLKTSIKLKEKTTSSQEHLDIFTLLCIHGVYFFYVSL